MSTPNENKNQINDKIGLSIFSIIAYCFCIIFVIGGIFTIIKYSMAASALSSGDTYSAAAILRSDAPQYGYSHRYGPYRQPINNPSLFTLKI